MFERRAVGGSVPFRLQTDPFPCTILVGRAFGPFSRSNASLQTTSSTIKLRTVVGGTTGHAGFQQAGDDHKFESVTSKKVADITQVAAIGINHDGTNSSPVGKVAEINEANSNNGPKTANRIDDSQLARTSKELLASTSSQYKFLRRQHSMDQKQLVLQQTRPSLVGSWRKGSTTRFESVDIIGNPLEDGIIEDHEATTKEHTDNISRTTEESDGDNKW